MQRTKRPIPLVGFLGLSLLLHVLVLWLLGRGLAWQLAEPRRGEIEPIEFVDLPPSSADVQASDTLRESLENSEASSPDLGTPSTTPPPSVDVTASEPATQALPTSVLAPFESAPPEAAPPQPTLEPEPDLVEWSGPIPGLESEASEAFEPESIPAPELELSPEPEIAAEPEPEPLLAPELFAAPESLREPEVLDPQEPTESLPETSPVSPQDSQIASAPASEPEGRPAPAPEPPSQLATPSATLPAAEPAPSPPATSAPLEGASSLGGLQGRRLRNSSGRFFQEEDRGGPKSLAARQNNILGPYYADIERRIVESWETSYSGQELFPVVSFEISRDGQLVDLKISQTSGLEQVDQDLLEAVRKAAPFAPLPESYPYQRLPIDFHFSVDVNS